MSLLFTSSELDRLYESIPNLEDFDMIFWIQDGQVRLRNSRIGIDFLFEDTFGQIIDPDVLSDMYEHLPRNLIAKAWEWALENQEWTRRYMIEIDQLTSKHRRELLERSLPVTRGELDRRIASIRGESGK